MFRKKESVIVSRTFAIFICSGIVEGVLFLTIAVVFPRGAKKKKKSNNEDTHDHGQEKRRPSTYVEEKTDTNQPEIDTSNIEDLEI